MKEIFSESSEYLKEQLRTGDFNASMLFVGQEGTGKLETALRFARTIICQEDTDLPCEKCSECKLTEKKSHPDLVVLDSEELIKINTIRDLQQNLYLKPFRASHKIAIINHAEKITEEAANSFLKILEEPPQNSILILIAKDKQFLIDTIVSRCQCLNFGALSGIQLDEVDSELVKLLDTAKGQQSISTLFRLAEVESKKNVSQFLRELEKIFRSSLIAMQTEADRPLVKNFSEKSIIKVLEETAKAYQYLNNNVNKRFLLENLFISFMVER